MCHLWLAHAIKNVPLVAQIHFVVRLHQTVLLLAVNLQATEALRFTGMDFCLSLFSERLFRVIVL